LGITLQELGRLDKAEASYNQAIALKSDFAEAHYNLGNTLKELGRLDEAEASYNQTIALKPDFADAHVNLGITLFEKEDDFGALNCFQQSCDLNRRSQAFDGHRLERPAAISKSKLNHDIEQFEYLASRHIERDHFSKLVSEYGKIRDKTPWATETGQTEVDPEFHATLVNSSKLLYRGGADRVNQAINGSLDTNSIYEKYFSHEFGLTYIDDFLSSEALASLRKFLLESTIWFAQKKGGYLGAYLKDGLASPLLLQIASELRSRFPLIIKNHLLNQVWAYKYDSRASDPFSDATGIRIHADFAAVNINFWITQSEANLDSDSGGMVVYNTEAPKDWSFDMYNNNLSRIQEELSKSKSGREVIPHRENRMVIFNSNLFHETDKYHFREGYENRRINVTMLFGKRENN
jgi:tetratricopeptide (TPR) repeat protein